MENVTQDDAGDYKCVMENEAGEGHSDTIHMEVAIRDISMPSAKGTSYLFLHEEVITYFARFETQNKLYIFRILIPCKWKFYVYFLHNYKL